VLTAGLRVQQSVDREILVEPRPVDADP